MESRIGVRLHHETRAALEEAARARRLCLSDYVRVTLEEAARRDAPPRETAPRKRPGTP
jgi:hypothetical protein